MPTVPNARFRVITPLFLGGADPDRPEVRVASIKAMLRQWYRAVDPNAVVADRKGGPRREDRVFGGAAHGAGQSPVLLRAVTSNSPEFDWSQVDLDRFTEGRGTHARNGLKYLGYPFHLLGNRDRRASAPGATFELACAVHKGREKDVDGALRRAWLSALWLFGNLGSLGTRSRRGFGSVEIGNWASIAQGSGWQEEAHLLPDLSEARSVKDWYAGIERAMSVFERWFEMFEEHGDRVRFDHPHLGRDMRLALLGSGYSDWQSALDTAGRRLQDFRVRRGPDYADVKRLLGTNEPLRQAPERAIFGLPLTFRYSSLPGRTAQFTPASPNSKLSSDRHGSPLRIRLVRLGEHLHPLFVRMDGALPAADPPAEVEWETTDRQRRSASLDPIDGRLLDEFMNSLAGGR